jgi:hypothetical protein
MNEYISAYLGEQVSKMAVCKALFPNETPRLTDRRLRRAATRYQTGDPFYDIVVVERWICTNECYHSEHSDTFESCFPLCYSHKVMQLNPMFFTASENWLIHVAQLEPLRYLFEL